MSAWLEVVTASTVPARSRKNAAAAFVNAAPN